MICVCPHSNFHDVSIEFDETLCYVISGDVIYYSTCEHCGILLVSSLFTHIVNILPVYTCLPWHDRLLAAFLLGFHPVEWGSLLADDNCKLYYVFETAEI